MSTARTPQLAAATPLFDAKQFFVGRTEGEGRLKALMSSADSVQVHGTGRIDEGGTLVLNQVVERVGEKPERRQWRINEVSPGRYSGTLTAAEGPITGVVKGNRLHLSYKLKKGGLKADQWLYLQPGGRTALNRMTLSKLGVPVATLKETIRKID